MNEIVTFTSEQSNVIKAQICPPGTTDTELKFFLFQCQRTGLDPMARQIYLIDQKGKKMVQTSIDGFRIIAQRSQLYAGQKGPFWCGKDGEWKDVWLSKDPPEACKVGVLKKDFIEPLWAVALRGEYEQISRNKDSGKMEPTFMWRTKPALMLAKVAESLALRKAFPNDMSGIYTTDELPEERPTYEYKTAPKELIDEAALYSELEAKMKNAKQTPSKEIETVMNVEFVTDQSSGEVKMKDLGNISVEPALKPSATAIQLNRISYLINKNKYDPQKLSERLHKQFGKSEIKLLNQEEAAWLIKNLEAVK